MKKEELLQQYSQGIRILSDKYFGNEEFSDLEFKNCDFSGSNFARCVFNNVVFSECQLKGAVFRNNTKLVNVSFNHCFCRCSYFKNVDLSSTTMYQTDLTDTELNNTLDEKIAASLFVPPETGSFKAYKKLLENKIALLEIPEHAKRSSATSRKCRASEAKVLAIWDMHGNLVNNGFSLHILYFEYVVGKTLVVEDFDENRWNECSTGIHFFLTRMEAENYN